MTTRRDEPMGAVVEHVRTMSEDYSKWIIDAPYSMARVIATNLQRRAKSGHSYGVNVVRRV